jgi:uncharacterized protein YjdB
MTREANGRFEETGDEVGWLSSDPSVAEVSEDGTVTGMAEGKVVISAGCNGYCAWATVYVTKLPASDRW